MLARYSRPARWFLVTSGTLAAAGIIAAVCAIAAYAQEPTPLPDGASGPAVNWVVVFAVVQGIGTALAFAIRLIPNSALRGWFDNAFIPRYLYVYYVLANILTGLTTFASSAGFPVSKVALAGFDWKAYLTAVVMAIYQVWIARRAYEEGAKPIRDVALATAGKASRKH